MIGSCRSAVYHHMRCNYVGAFKRLHISDILYAPTHINKQYSKQLVQDACTAHDHMHMCHSE